MSLPQGCRIFVLYDVGAPELYHERYILASCACGRGWHIVLTPDFDMFPEQISLENDDLSGFRVCHDGVMPPGLDATNTYRFQNMPDAATLQQMLRDAEVSAAALAFPPGAGLGLAAAPAGPPAAAVAPAGPAATWVYVESSGGHLRGDVVTLQGTEILRGGVGLKQEGGEWLCIRSFDRAQDVKDYKGKEASADARLLGLQFQGTVREERLWRDVSKEVQEEPMSDWSIPGPRTSQWRIRFLNRKNGGPVDHHRWWSSNLGLKSHDWGVAEHEHLMKILDKLGRYDGLDLSNLAGVEMAFRRAQLIEYFYSERGPGGGKGSGKGKKEDKKEEGGLYQMEASIFSGSHKEFGDTMVAPDLMDYVSREVEREASIMKQVRKAREERAAVNK